MTNKESIFLTLGDGDFSFSADVAAFCRQEEPRQAAKIYATGFDSASALATKYKNSNFLLRQLRSDDLLTVQVYHDINAVKPDRTSNLKADHVIFNHPHLAVEDAQLHSRFIAHFFHAARSSWMASNGGLIHLTLAKGQCERWQCLEIAKRQELILLERNIFSTPLQKDARYQHRRHQTGKSFSRRTTGSETLTFGRISDKPFFAATHLPWQQMSVPPQIDDGFPCPDCGKVFTEDRARISHCKAVHGVSKKRNREEVLECVHCTERSFPHQDALQDHMRAKHSGHFKILPDWAAEAKQLNKPKCHEDQTWGECDICGFEFTSASDREEHLNDFIPQSDLVAETHECFICSKQFSDSRAKLQHENFCSQKNINEEKRTNT